MAANKERVKETLLLLLGGDDRYALNPNFKNLCLFYEYFHGDTGRGCGARYVIMAIFSIMKHMLFKEYTENINHSMLCQYLFAMKIS